MKSALARVVIAMTVVAAFGVGALVGRFATRSAEAAAAGIRHAPPFASEEALVAANGEPAARPRQIVPAAQRPARVFDAAIAPQPGKPPALDKPDDRSESSGAAGDELY